MRWHHHVHEKYFFLHSISVSEYLNPFRSVCIWFFKPTELGFFCSLHKILHNVYFIIFTTPPPPSPTPTPQKMIFEMWSNIFSNIFKKYTHVLKYSLFIVRSLQTTTAPRRMRETRVPKCQLTSLITSIFLSLIHRCPPTRRMF